MPPGAPLLLVSASMPPLVLADIRRSVNVDTDTSFYLNMGNDRPNITHEVRRMAGKARDLASLDCVIESMHRGARAEKTIVFTNSRMAAQEIWRYFCKSINEIFHCRIAFIHAGQTSQKRKRTMGDFRCGLVDVLVATEVAGMVRSVHFLHWAAFTIATAVSQGLDIPDIKLVVQCMVTTDLSIWIQRAGRGGRSMDIQARAVLLVEKSAWERQGKGGKVKVEEMADVDTEAEDEARGDDTPKYRKKVDESMRGWIDAQTCRRDIADDFFDNPPHRKRKVDCVIHIGCSHSHTAPTLAPTGICCDQCATIETTKNSHPERAIQTPSPCPPLNDSPAATPSATPNKNGKRAMIHSTSRSDGPQTRRGDHLKRARDALERWRLETRRTMYRKASWTATGLLPDSILTTIASNARFKTMGDLREGLRQPWIFLEAHGEEILALLRELDEVERADRQRIATQKREVKKRATIEWNTQKAQGLRQRVHGTPTNHSAFARHWIFGPTGHADVTSPPAFPLTVPFLTGKENRSPYPNTPPAPHVAHPGVPYSNGILPPPVHPSPCFVLHSSASEAPIQPSSAHYALPTYYAPSAYFLPPPSNLISQPRAQYMSPPSTLQKTDLASPTGSRTLLME